MRSWIKRTLYGLFGATVVPGGLSACSHQRHDGGWQMSAQGPGRFRERMVERVASRLDLNEDQQLKLGLLADTLRSQRTAILAQGGDARVQLQALVSADKFDGARAQALVSGKTSAVNARSPEVSAALGDVYDSLKPAQQARVRECMQRRRAGGAADPMRACTGGDGDGGDIAAGGRAAGILIQGAARGARCRP